MKGEQTKLFCKENTQGCGVSLQSLSLYITSLSFLTHISSLSKDREQIQQKHIMYLDWSLLPPVFLSAVFNGSPGASGLSRTDGLRSPRANLSPKWFVSSLSPVMILFLWDLALLRALPPGCTVLEVHIRWALKPPILRLHLQLHLPDLSKVNFCCCDDSHRAVLFEPLPSCIHILFLKIV